MNGYEDDIADHDAEIPEHHAVQEEERVLVEEKSPAQPHAIAGTYIFSRKISPLS